VAEIGLFVFSFAMYAKQTGKDLLECPVCHAPLRNPHILITCGHTFCRGCINSAQCPQCWKRFTPGQVVPHVAANQAVMQAPGTQSPFVASYVAMGCPPRLAELLADEDAVIAERVFVLDNSGSTALCDGHVLEPSVTGNVVLTQSTRWQEVACTAMNHARWAAQLGVPAQFVLLNSRSMVNPQEGVDFCRVDARVGIPDLQIQALQHLLSATFPTGGTPLATLLEQMLPRLKAKYPIGAGQKFSVTLVTDGVPNEPKQYFVQALRRFGCELPVQLTIRLCTDEDAVTEFYDSVDREIEFALDIVDDLMGEARNVYRQNPWITYSVFLHTVREAGTLTKLFDFIDERPLTAMEAALYLQYCVFPSNVACPRDPKQFVEVLQRYLSDAPRVFDIRTRSLRPPVDFDGVASVLYPSHFSVPSKVLRGVGLGDLVDWWHGEEEPAQMPLAQGASTGPVGMQMPAPIPCAMGGSSFVMSQAVEYYSSSHQRWIPCAVTQVNGQDIQIDIKPGVWLSPNPAVLRPFQPPVSTGAVSQGTMGTAGFVPGQHVEYHSPSHGNWIACQVSAVSLTEGVQVNIKPGVWIPYDRAQTCLRPTGTAQTGPTLTAPAAAQPGSFAVSPATGVSMAVPVGVSMAAEAPRANESVPARPGTPPPPVVGLDQMDAGVSFPAQAPQYNGSVIVAEVVNTVDAKGPAISAQVVSR